MEKPKNKVIVFIAVPSKASGEQYEVWCNVPPPNRPELGWHLALGSETLERAMAIYLGASMSYRNGTEFRVAVLKTSGTTWRVDKFLGSDTDAAACEGGAVLARLWADYPEFLRLIPAPASSVDSSDPAPEPLAAVEEPAPAPCWFCVEPAVGGALGGPQICETHAPVAVIHGARLGVGGAVDCPETREETLRFWKGRRLVGDQEAAIALGFRTRSDLPDASRISTSLKDQKAPVEEIPLVGTTPHYEWP